MPITPPRGPLHATYELTFKNKGDDPIREQGDPGGDLLPREPLKVLGLDVERTTPGAGP
ncbi:MAG: hypothetical protein J7J17_02265 [Hadesarchaea archaeon]|nr:hypothetical protein [Hadesarchaea archaeon]